MQRDMELVRKIFVEVHSWGQTDFREVKIEGYDPTQVHWQVAQMVDAGLLDGDVRYSSLGDGVVTADVRGVKWEGSELADVILNDSVWARLKAIYPDKLATMSFSVLTSVGSTLAVEMTKKAVGI